MTVAVFGGSFSPVHIGHLDVATSILARGLADEVWLMPCRQNPLKTGIPPANDATRVANLRKAADYYREKGVNGIKIDLTELYMPLPSYTADTMKTLREKYPDVEFRLIAGADSYLQFEKWKDWEWLEANFRPIVYPRPGYPVEDLRPGWTLLEGAILNDISSTEIRRMAKAGEDISRYTPWYEQ